MSIQRIFLRIWILIYLKLFPQFFPRENFFSIVSGEFHGATGLITEYAFKNRSKA